MVKELSNFNYVLLVLVVTVFVVLVLILIPGYLREPNSENIGLMSLKFVVVFLIIDLILIGIPMGLHKIYVNDYDLLKGVWFFSLFGGVVGGLIGERSFIMILPYTLLMLIYAFLYKRFKWWKVALTTLLAGILIENVMNRSPIQTPTLLWISFFIYPYFVAKIWENRDCVNVLEIVKDMKYVFVSVVVLLLLTKFIVKSIPWAFVILAIAISLFGFIVQRIKNPYP